MPLNSLKSLPLRTSLFLALPLIASNLTVPIMGMIDTAVVGRLPGAHNLAAVALGATAVNVAIWGTSFLRTATGGLTAQAYGAERVEELKTIHARAVLIAAIAALALLAATPLLVAGAALVFATDASPELDAAFRAYLTIRLLGAPFILFNHTLQGWFLGQQRPSVALAMTVAAASLNAGLSVAFVLGLGWGIEGAAWATVIGDAAGSAVGLWFWRRRWLTLPAGLPGWKRVVSRGPLFRFLSLGRDIFLRTLMLNTAYVIFAALAAREGELTLAANAVLLNFMTLQAYGLDGFADAAEAMTGKAVGRGRADELRRAVAASFVNAGVLSLAFTVAFALGGAGLVALLTTLPEVRAEAGRYLPFVAALPVVAIAAFVWDGVFFGATRGRDIRNAMAVALAVFVVAAFALREPYGNAGLWSAQLLFLAARGLLLGGVYGWNGWGAGFVAARANQQQKPATL